MIPYRSETSTDASKKYKMSRNNFVAELGGYLLT